MSHNINLSEITDATHTFKAGYAINRIDSYPFDLENNNLQDIVNETLDFWNDAEETIEKFTVTNVSGNAESVEVTIEGLQKDITGESDDTYLITVNVIADAK